ncbi:30S ribosome-binding factor RbfA [Dehalococcoidia bacterium]|nr:30S ribosome-binding factor RbfA [Dehalococcoidia bacterium]
MSRRVDRINGLLREEISKLLLREIKDPRLSGLLTITQVTTSPDLRNAKVYLSVLGDDEASTAALQGIQSAATFLRKQLRERLRLKYVPFLTFEIDDSMETSDHIFRLMDQARQESDASLLSDEDIRGAGPKSSSTIDFEQ